MALKPILDSVESLPAPVREHYTKGDDGKYHLALDGDHPKVAEFRTTNVALLKERDELKEKFKDIDPAVVAADRTRLAELEKAKPHERITALEAENATLKAAAADAQAKADRVSLRSAIKEKALAAGALPEGVEMLCDKAEEKFERIEAGIIKAKANLFSPNSPGTPLSIQEWLASASREFHFLWKRSSGSGSSGDGSGVGATSSVRIIRNPSATDLGKWASEVVAGRARFEHDN